MGAASRAVWIPGSTPPRSSVCPCRRTRRPGYEPGWRRFDSFQGLEGPVAQSRKSTGKTIGAGTSERGAGHLLHRRLGTSQGGVGRGTWVADAPNGTEIPGRQGSAFPEKPLGPACAGSSPARTIDSINASRAGRARGPPKPAAPGDRPSAVACKVPLRGSLEFRLDSRAELAGLRSGARCCPRSRAAAGRTSPGSYPGQGW